MKIYTLLIFKHIKNAIEMCIKPSPYTYYCPSCGWKKMIVPRSDMLMPNEVYSFCPACNYKELKKKPLSFLDKVIQNLYWGKYR